MDVEMRGRLCPADHGLSINDVAGTSRFLSSGRMTSNFVELSARGLGPSNNGVSSEQASEGSVMEDCGAN